LCSPISSVRKYFIYSKEYRQENRKQDELIYPLEVEEQVQLKRGKYVNSVWMCNECAEREEKEKSSPSSTMDNKRSSDDDQSDSIGVASPADVSPNTPKADEADL
jgi:tRNA A37 threonylcarbamoyladenosine modification protein TsaB